MLAPEPIFESRGTPLSVYHRCKTLGEQGCQIEVVTYHIGDDFCLDNVRLRRIPSVPFVDEVPIGPSFTKVVLDLFVFALAFRLLLNGRDRYEVLHAHEEAVAMGLVLSRLFGLKLVYDMHSSMPQQLSNFDFSDSRVLHFVLEHLERQAIRDSDMIIVICDYLMDSVQEIDTGANVHLIENTPMAEIDGGDLTPAEIRSELDLKDENVVLYTGTFEPYQGIDMVIKSIQYVEAECEDFVFLLVGGDPEQVETMQEWADELEVSDCVLFTGQRPVEEMPAFMSLGDVLLSPRVSGTNTPLKIYSYLKAGKPIVATRMPAHTQVLSADTALLTDPTPEEFGEGVAQLLSDRDLRNRLGEAGLELANEKYTVEQFEKKHEVAYASLGN